MRKDPSNPKYIKAEVLTPRVRIGPIVKEVIRIEVVGHTKEKEDSMGTIDLDNTIETTIFERTLEDIEDKIVEENIGMIGTIIIIEAEIDQEKRHSQGIMAIIGIVLVIADQDQGPELVLIETG